MNVLFLNKIRSSTKKFEKLLKQKSILLILIILFGPSVLTGAWARDTMVRDTMARDTRDKNRDTRDRDRDTRDQDRDKNRDTRDQDRDTKDISVHHAKKKENSEFQENNFQFVNLKFSSCKTLLKIFF